ncbi:hypothetical protein [Haliangium sp.]|uniref:hypothetical protein n=1 Tax=Haliangium sp. TaxID=2663208 RepID=UPI003D0B3261
MNLRNLTGAALTAALATTLLTGCSRDTNERWATTSNTNVDIDWDKVQEAYKSADGPKDFETKVNEIYEGDELISISVHDKDAKTQVVTGFFDNNSNGAVEENEKIFELQRDVVDENQVRYSAAGYGHYHGYRHTSMWDIAGGVIVGSMIANALMPGYRPMYATPYRTSTTRMGELRNYRSSYRAKNPTRFTSGKASGSGRSYGSKGSSFGTRSTSGRSRRSFGGGGFGVEARRRRKRKRVHLEA